MTDREKLIELIEQAYYCSIEEMADHLIANGVTLDNQVASSKWISVKDRLPNCKKVIDGETYFNNVAVRVKGCGFEKIAYYDDEEKYWFDTNFFPAVGEVTHWCELPNGICPNRRKEIRN